MNKDIAPERLLILRKLSDPKIQIEVGFEDVGCIGDKVYKSIFHIPGEKIISSVYEGENVNERLKMDAELLSRYDLDMYSAFLEYVLKESDL